MIIEKYNIILEQIRKIRPNNTPQLISVSKKQPIQKIEEAISCGIRVFGENQVKEGIEKFSKFLSNFPSLEIHHIGPVQTGTIRKLFGIYSYTHGIGSQNTLNELIKQAENKKISINYFLQVNLTEEISKSGFSKQNCLNILQSISNFDSEFAKFHGLMTIGPSNGDLNVTRRIFKELNQIRNDFYPKAKLSMGMSGDFQLAAEEGSDYIRVGSAIFGERILK